MGDPRPTTHDPRPTTHDPRTTNPRPTHPRRLDNLFLIMNVFALLLIKRTSSFNPLITGNLATSQTQPCTNLLLIGVCPASVIRYSFLSFVVYKCEKVKSIIFMRKFLYMYIHNTLLKLKRRSDNSPD